MPDVESSVCCVHPGKTFCGSEGKQAGHITMPSGHMAVDKMGPKFHSVICAVICRIVTVHPHQAALFTLYLSEFWQKRCSSKDSRS